MEYSIIPTHKIQYISQIPWSPTQNIPSHPSINPPPSKFTSESKKLQQSRKTIQMPLKTLRVSNLANLDQVHESPTLPSPGSMPAPKFTVIGHRGNGMNSITSSITKENSILSFNEAGRYPIQFIEFDVQVTADDQPVIFHDNFIVTENSEKRVTDLSLHQFLSYNTKPLLRRTHDGKLVNWTVQNDDSLCTLEEAFLKVSPHLGFNIELKFDDDIVYTDEHLVRSLKPVIDCVVGHEGSKRPIIFSTFHPDAARLIRMMQSNYEVYFLTDGGTEIYGDVRRNSLQEAVGLCEEFGLQGIVSEVRAVLRESWVVSKAKEAGLGLFTYGELNNGREVVWLQHLMGIDGVIVDRVGEIAEAVDDFLRRDQGDDVKPRLLRNEIDFLLRLIPELIKK